MNKCLKRGFSILLIILMLIGLIPQSAIKVYAATPVINNIEIVKTYEGGFASPSVFYLTILGTDLNTLNTKIQNNLGAIVDLTPTSTGSFSVQYKINPAEMGSRFFVNGVAYDIFETDMPEIKAVDPKLVKKNNNIKITGENFSKIDQTPTSGNPKITVKYTNTLTHKDLSAILKAAGATGEALVPVDLGLGLQDIRVDKQYTSSGVNVSLSYRYIDAFRIYDDITVNPTNITIFPNKGKPGTKISVSTTDTFNEDYSVFFMKDITDAFKHGNKGRDYFKSVDNKNIKVKVPDSLATGETYKVVLTNSISQGTNDTDDLTGYVIKQKIIGEFVVIDADISPQIQFVQPSSGPDSGSNVNIIGKYMDELNIEGLQVTGGGNLEYDNKVIDGEKLKLTYDATGIKYNTRDVDNIERELLVTIGRTTNFPDINAIKFDDGGGDFDKLLVKTKPISDSELADPVKDVIIEIKTTIHLNGGGTVVFTETAVKEDAYEFVPSFVAPEITKTSPNKVQVEGTGPYTVREDTVIALQGKNFKVYSYTDAGGTVKVNYPIVVLGTNGTTPGDGEISLKRVGAETEVVDADNNPIPGATYEILDKTGNKVDGVAGNETGTIIIVKIPAARQIKQGLIGVQSAVAIANPIKGGNTNGPLVSKNDADTGIEFIKAINSPEINKISPNIVTIKGGEKIVVRGTNFLDGIKVYIDGKEVGGVVRDTDPATTEGTLTFTAPKGREGITVLQVINPDGGSDSEQFVYVKSANQDPKINSIGPNKGSKGTLVVVKGNNFFKADLTVDDVAGMGIYNLIGTRILLDGKDVNTYSGNPDIPEKPISYTLPELNTEKLIKVKDYKLRISKYKEYATIAEIGSPDNIYTFRVDSQGSAVLTRGGNSYVIKVDSAGNYTCQKNGTNVAVTVTDNNITIDGVNLKATFNYDVISIKKLENGTKKIIVSDYFDSLYLRNSANKYFKIFVDQKGKVKISNSNDTEYSIGIDGGNLVAIKNGTKYSFEIDANRKQIFIDRGNANELVLEIETLYYFDANNFITGHRTKVVNKKEIRFLVPPLGIQKWYDVTVKNPDTKSDTKTGENGFMYYKSPTTNPRIINIVPKQGTTKGGTPIVISGEEFQDTSTVYIAGVRIADKDVTLSNNMRELTVIVPKYPGDVSEDFTTDRKTVPVVIVNEDGGKAVKDDGFTYIIANSVPRIKEIYPKEGSAAGGEIVDIFGYDFRFHEPYTGDIGEANFEYDDLDEDLKWDNMNNKDDVDARYKLPFVHDKYTHYYDSPVLPKVYFGNVRAKIVAFNSATGYIQVIAPKHMKAETVDLCVINNDSGKSNSVPYKYKKSNPVISLITPKMGKKEGNEAVDIMGSGFKKSLIDIFDDNPAVTTTKNLYLVRFGSISNAKLPKDHANSGRIINGRTHIELNGGLTVDYVLDSSTGNIDLTTTIKEGDQTYRKKYVYNDETKYLDVVELKNIDTTKPNYVGYEYIKYEVKDGRLIVTRGYSKDVTLKYASQLLAKTPNYHTVGTVDVVMENPDNASNAMEYIYKNPISNPTITAVTGVPFKIESGKLIIQAPTTGGQPFYIEGTQFIQEGITVRIGGYPLKADDFQYLNENKILVKPHKMNTNLQTGREYLIEVQNEDGARATTENIKVYYRYIVISGDEPIIDTIEPAKGSATGGYTVIIKGKNFASNIKVIFGYSASGSGAQILEKSINKLVVRVPASNIVGLVDVYVENIDYNTSSVKQKAFEYISNPTIDTNSITPNEIFITGGQKVTIKGTQFIQGLEVKFGNLVCPKVEVIDTNTIVVESPVATMKDLGFKDVTITNKDGGVATVKNGIKYVVPKPTDPTGFIAKPGHERSVVLKWDKVEGAQTYKIFGKTKGDREYSYIGETKDCEYFLRDLEPNTRYYFKLWSVNKYDESAKYAYANCRTFNENKDEGNDKYEEVVEENTKTVINQDSISVKLPETFSQGQYILDLRGDVYRKSDKLSITIPMKAILAGKGYIYVQKDDFKLHVPLVNMKVNAYKHLYKDKDTNVIINIDKVDSREKARVTKGLSRKQKSVSELYDVKVVLQEGKNKGTLKMLEGFTFSMLVDTNKVKQNKISIMSYDEPTNKLKAESYEVSSVTEHINDTAKYVINIAIKEDKKLIVIYNR
ncbi:IPT/TIG domain-containing protein [Clostridiaceae bacterium M8S5]|nr:IPT/TIG domain-containing protein [Clostridiaceae bacterium M8S5]